jgi:hypothetical protein
MADPEARELTSDDFAEWDKLVMESPQGTIFQTSDWLRLCAEEWRGKTKFWGCFQNDELIGGCALRVLNIGFLKRAANSSMMTPYAGVILKPLLDGAKLKRVEVYYRDVINSLCSQLEDLSYVRLSNSPSFVDVRPFTQRGWVPKVKYTYVLSLPEATLNHFTKDMRYEIRKAEKQGIKIERSSDGARYFELYRSMLLRKGASPPPMKLGSFFQKVVELLHEKGIGELWFAKTPYDEIAAGEITVFDNKRAYCWSAASNDKHLHTGATSSLLYQIIEHFRDRFKELDMGGADFFELHHHSAEFNPALVPCYTVEKSSLTTQIFYSLLQRANSSRNYLSNIANRNKQKLSLSETK